MIRTVIANDANDLRLLLRLVLDTDDRFAVVGEAADGEQALDLVEEQHPDLLVLDLAMPKMDGLEVLADLGGRIPPTVVVLSGFTSAEAVEQALELGAASYVTKGNLIGDLPDVLAEVMHAANEGPHCP
jgi:DNA-binding NarL/FixJ family response regulator